jgi:hypothetical protein
MAPWSRRWLHQSNHSAVASLDLLKVPPGPAPALLGRHARPLARRPPACLTQFRSDSDPTQLSGHSRDHAEALATLGGRLAYHPDGALAQLGRVPLLAGVLLVFDADIRLLLFPRNGVSIEPRAVHPLLVVGLGDRLPDIDHAGLPSNGRTSTFRLQCFDPSSASLSATSRSGPR